MSRVPLSSAAECMYRGKPLSLRMNLDRMHDKGVKDKSSKKSMSHTATYTQTGIHNEYRKLHMYMLIYHVRMLMS